jgi:Zn-dependent M32 family carboxypeptidase
MFENLQRLLSRFRTIKKIDEISSMERVGRDEYRYVEGDHVLTLQIEMLSGEPRRVIYSRTIKKWLPPHDNEVISDEKRKQIIEKISQHFEMNRVSYVVQ